MMSTRTSAGNEEPSSSSAQQNPSLRLGFNMRRAVQLATKDKRRGQQQQGGNEGSRKQRNEAQAQEQEQDDSHSHSSHPSAARKRKGKDVRSLWQSVRKEIGLSRFMKHHMRGMGKSRRKEYTRSLIKRAVQAKSTRPASKASRMIKFNASTLYFLILEKEWWFCCLLGAIVYSLPVVLLSLVAIPLTFDNDTGDAEWEIYGRETDQVILAFRFTAGNIISMGFGTVFPTSNVGYLLATFEQLLGILINVFVFAAVLAKFQSPQADLIFSKQACVFTRDSVRFLCIRVGNLRCHCLFNPTIKLYLLQDRETAEGESFITIKQLSVDEPGTISGVYNITHKIDSESPLFALSEKEIKSGNRNIALQCVFSALDPVYQAEVCSKSSYGMDSIKFGVRFEDMVQVGEDGRPALDFAYFEELISVPEYWEWEDQRLHASEMDNSEAPISFSQSLCLVVGYGRSSYADPFLDGDLPLSGMRAECVFTLSIAMMLAEAGVEYEEYRCDLGDKPDWLKEVNAELQTPACRLAKSEEWLNGTDHIFDCLRETIPRVSELFEVELPPNVKDDKDYYDPMRLAFSLSLAHANTDCKMRSFLFDKSGISPELGGKESESILREKCLEKLHRWEASLGGIENDTSNETSMNHMHNSKAPPARSSKKLLLVVGYGRSSYADPFLDGDLPLSGMRAECVFTLSIAMMLTEAGVEYEEYRCDLGDKPDWLKEVNPELQTPACRLARSKEWLNGTDHIFDCLRETIPRVSELFGVALPSNVKDDKDYYDPGMLAFSLSLAHANRDCKMRSFLFDISGISPELGGKESESILREKCLERLHRWEASLRGIGNESNLYLCGDKPGHLDLILAPKLYLAFQLFESGLANLGEGKSFQKAAPLCFEYLRRMEKRESWKKAFGPGYEIASGRLHVPMLRVLCNKFVAMCPELNDTVTLPALQKARKTNHERNLYLCGDRPAYLDMQLASKLYFAFQLFESGLANLGKSFQEAAPLCFDYLRRMEKRESWKKAFGPGYEISLGRLHVPMLRVLCKKFVAMCPEINDTVTIPALEKARRTKLVRTKSQNSESSLGKKVVSATLCL